MSQPVTLDLNLGNGVDAMLMSTLMRVIATVDPQSTVENRPGGYRFTLSGKPDLSQVPQRLRDLADALDDD